MRGSEKLITLIPRAFLWVNESEHLILVLLHKANLEHNKACASDWLKPPISTLLTHIHFGFLFYIPDLALCYKKSIYSSSIGHFHVTDNSTGWGKNQTCPIFTLCASRFYPKSGVNSTSLKVIFLIRKLPKMGAIATVMEK